MLFLVAVDIVCKGPVLRQKPAPPTPSHVSLSQLKNTKTNTTDGPYERTETQDAFEIEHVLVKSELNAFKNQCVCVYIHIKLNTYMHVFIYL